MLVKNVFQVLIFLVLILSWWTEVQKSFMKNFEKGPFLKGKLYFLLLLFEDWVKTAKIAIFMELMTNQSNNVNWFQLFHANVPILYDWKRQKIRHQHSGLFIFSDLIKASERISWNKFFTQICVKLDWTVFHLIGPILKTKGMGTIFQKKGKIFANLDNVQNLKIFGKKAGDCVQ